MKKDIFISSELYMQNERCLFDLCVGHTMSFCLSGWYLARISCKVGQTCDNGESLDEMFA